MNHKEHANKKPLDKTWLVPAKTGIQNAQRELTYSVAALQKTGGDFSDTIKCINLVIDDLQDAVDAFEYLGV